MRRSYVPRRETSKIDCWWYDVRRGWDGSPFQEVRRETLITNETTWGENDARNNWWDGTRCRFHETRGDGSETLLASEQQNLISQCKNANPGPAEELTAKSNRIIQIFKSKRTIRECYERESLRGRTMDVSDYFWDDWTRIRQNCIVRRDTRKSGGWWDKVRWEWDAILFRDMKRENSIADETNWDEIEMPVHPDTWDEKFRCFDKTE